LDALTDEYPLDERLCASGCWRPTGPAGRPKRCAPSSTLRRNLAQELGLEPGPELVELERRMLDHDPALRAGAPARIPIAELEAAPVALEVVSEHSDALRNMRASQLQLGLATVAVLITDLVGSASMRTRLGDHRADGWSGGTRPS
jgi:hypothetical protein